MNKLNHFVHSFRFRLTLLFVAILAVFLTGFSVFIYTRQLQVLRSEAATRLTSGSIQLASYYDALVRRTFEEADEAHLGNLAGGKLPLLGQDDFLAVIGADGMLSNNRENY